jgi:hypothetical protein
MVVKAVSEQGERLNIRKETLRHWRAEFARHLRALGVAANATERAVRGETRTPKLDGIYRAMRRGDSWHMRNRVEEIAHGLAPGSAMHDAGKSKLTDTRSEVVRGWSEVSDLLDQQGERSLAARVRAFMGGLPPPQTEKELIAEQLKRQLAAQRTRSILREDSR